MAELVIRKGLSKDIDDIAMLEQVCFPTPWSRDAVAYEINENKMATYIVAELAGKVVGYIGFWAVIDHCQINNIAVSPLYRRQHIAQILIQTAIDSVKAAGVLSFTLEVRKSNEAAISLYKKCNFIENGVRKGYYEDNGEDAIIMWRDDNPKENNQKEDNPKDETPKEEGNEA